MQEYYHNSFYNNKSLFTLNAAMHTQKYAVLYEYCSTDISLKGQKYAVHNALHGKYEYCSIYVHFNDKAVLCVQMHRKVRKRIILKGVCHENFDLQLFS